MKLLSATWGAVLILTLFELPQEWKLGGEYANKMLVVCALHFVLMPRFARPRGHVVWLRRFNQFRGGAFDAEAVISAAASGIAIPLTLQDKAVPWAALSEEIALRRRWLLRVALFLPPMFLLLLIGGIFLTRWCGWVGSVYVVVALAVGSWWLFRGPSDRTLNITMGVGTQACELVARIRHGTTPFLGPVVIETPTQTGDLWKEVVSTLVEGAVAVIMDTAELTENIQWEIDLVANHRDGCKLIVLHPYTGGEATLTSEMERAVSSVRDCEVIHWPCTDAAIRLTGLSPRAAFRRVTAELRRSLRRRVRMQRGSLVATA